MRLPQHCYQMPAAHTALPMGRPLHLLMTQRRLPTLRAPNPARPHPVPAALLRLMAALMLGPPLPLLLAQMLAACSQATKLAAHHQCPLGLITALMQDPFLTLLPAMMLYGCSQARRCQVAGSGGVPRYKGGRSSPQESASRHWQLQQQLQHLMVPCQGVSFMGELTHPLLLLLWLARQPPSRR